MKREELKITAELAQLELGEAETVRLQKEVSQMLENFSKMDELNVSDVPPTTHILAEENPMRQDQAELRPHTKELLYNAPESDGQFFIVPNVL